MTVLGRRLRRDVLPLLLTYIGCAVLIALIQILSLVLARLVALIITMVMVHDDSVVPLLLIIEKESGKFLFFSAYAAAISRKNKRPESRAGQYAPPLLQQAKPGDFDAYLNPCHN